MSFTPKKGDNHDGFLPMYVKTLTKELQGCKDENLNSDAENMRAFLKFTSSLKITDPLEFTPEWYYGVYIPHDVLPLRGDETRRVYMDKEEALKVMKLSKKARLKQFRTYEEASDFSEIGAEVMPNSTPTHAAVEKHSPFKGPKQQAIIQFKKAIDSGDIAMVRAAILENPRFLVSSGDTPAILQEGCRYNALHIASRKNQAAIAELILSSVTSFEVLGRLYDEKNEKALRQRSTVLLDLYLNTPDKGCNDTPLHIACKFGAIDVVDLLLSYPECRRDAVNKYNETPKKVVCNREGDHELKKRILDLMEEKFFLPVLRYEDNTIQPKIGEPFSPIKPLDIKVSPLSPRIEIQAYAGPMSQQKVKEFRKKWKTPPVLVKNCLPRLSDPEKGLERVGRNIAHDMKVPWREFWPFLNTFVDLSSNEGLDLLEKYLEERFNDTFNESIHESENVNEEEVSPISHLCNAFQACSLNDTAQRPLRINMKKLRREKNFIAQSDEVVEDNEDGCLQFSPLLCVERSCKVFGNRIANAIICLSTSEPSSVASEMFRDNLETEVRHLQTLITGYLEDERFHSVDFSVVHRRVASIAVIGIRVLLPSEVTFLTLCLRDISLADGTVSDDEDFRLSFRPNEKHLLRTILKTHLMCITECLLSELAGPEVAPNTVQTESECEALWSSTSPCVCKWAANSDAARARVSCRRKHKIMPKLLNFSNDDESSSIEESWRSCEDDATETEQFITPPSSPSPSEDLEETISLPDTFILSTDKPTKTDFAVMEAIKDCKITTGNYPNIYRWRHLVQLHQDCFLPDVSTTASPSRKINVPTVSPIKARWERVTGLYSPRRPR